MVRAPAARAHPPAHARAVAPRDRAGVGGGAHAVPPALAARRRGDATAWIARARGDRRAAPGGRGGRGVLGEGSAAGAARRVRSRLARSALPARRGRVGPLRAAAANRTERSFSSREADARYAARD